MIFKKIYECSIKQIYEVISDLEAKKETLKKEVNKMENYNNFF